MSNYRTHTLAATLAGLAAAFPGGKVLSSNQTDDAAPSFTPAQTERWKDQRGYPQTGTGKRAGERYARQMRHFMLRTPSMGLHIKHSGRWWNRDDPNLPRDVRDAYINERLRISLEKRK